MIIAERSVSHTEFWPLTRVVEVTGVSKSVIYQQMKLGLFPQSHSYQFSDKRRFWLSNDVKRWQQRQLVDKSQDLEEELDNEFDALLK